MKGKSDNSKIRFIYPFLYRPFGSVELLIPAIFFLLAIYSLLPTIFSLFVTTLLTIFIDRNTYTAIPEIITTMSPQWLFSLGLTSALGLVVSAWSLNRIYQSYAHLIENGHRVKGKIKYIGYGGIGRALLIHGLSYKIIYSYSFKGKEYNTYKLVHPLRWSVYSEIKREHERGGSLQIVVNPNNPNHNLILNFFK